MVANADSTMSLEKWQVQQVLQELLKGPVKDAAGGANRKLLRRLGKWWNRLESQSGSRSYLNAVLRWSEAEGYIDRSIKGKHTFLIELTGKGAAAAQTTVNRHIDWREVDADRREVSLRARGLWECEKCGVVVKAQSVKFHMAMQCSGKAQPVKVIHVAPKQPENPILADAPTEIDGQISLFNQPLTDDVPSEAPVVAQEPRSGADSAAVADALLDRLLARLTEDSLVPQLKAINESIGKKVVALQKRITELEKHPPTDSKALELAQTRLAQAEKNNDVMVKQVQQLLAENKGLREQVRDLMGRAKGRGSGLPKDAVDKLREIQRELGG